MRIFLSFEVYDKYISSSTIGPGKQVELSFKIKAPYEDDLYMLKFYASTKNMLGATGNSVRHYIPVLVSSSSPEILLLDVSVLILEEWNYKWKRFTLER
jgi:hypothetical protein